MAMQQHVVEHGSYIHFIGQCHSINYPRQSLHVYGVHITFTSLIPVSILSKSIAGLMGRYRPAIDLERMLAGMSVPYSPKTYSGNMGMQGYTCHDLHTSR